MADPWPEAGTVAVGPQPVPVCNEVDQQREHGEAHQSCRLGAATTVTAPSPLSIRLLMHGDARGRGDQVADVRLMLAIEGGARVSSEPWN